MSKKQKEAMEYMRLERVVVEQGEQLESCWKFLHKLKDMNRAAPADINQFLTNQPFYDMEGRHGAKTEGKATPTTGD